jgi:hypothetical protein
MEADRRKVAVREEKHLLLTIDSFHIVWGFGVHTIVGDR